MLASSPASMVNQKSTDLGIPNRFRLNSSCFRRETRIEDSVREAQCPQPVKADIRARMAISGVGPTADIGRFEIPQRSTPRCDIVLSVA